MEGIDSLFVGPYDLSGSLGRPGLVDTPEATSAIARVLAVAKSKNIAAGIFAGSAAIAQRYQEQGFFLIAVASDGMLLGRAAASQLSLLNG